MNALHHLVATRKVLYLVSLYRLARDLSHIMHIYSRGYRIRPLGLFPKRTSMRMTTGKTPFVIYQGAWNVMDRSFERDIIPMAAIPRYASLSFLRSFSARILTVCCEKQALLSHHGTSSLAVAFAPTPKKSAVGPLARTDARSSAPPGSARPMSAKCRSRSRRLPTMSRALKESKKARSLSPPSQSRTSCRRHHTVFPIVGGRKIEHLKQNIEALSIALSEEQVKELEGVLPFEPGFPHNFIVSLLLCLQFILLNMTC